MKNRLQKVSSRVTFILGGAASGKSAFAEEIVENYVKSKVYLATSQYLDDEMRAKVATHRARRGPDWTTIEAPLHCAAALARLGADQVCLMDCATMWLTNHLLSGSDIDAEQAALLSAIDACPADLVIVSNEVGQGIVPENALARRFREAQGRLNIALAGRADRVILIAAGLPLAIKGALP
ncbi:adenosylcobinamide kinase / adenosylcobinamide-phosphate guanylyltransferase [Jhaorihella thermophila]|uniref:Bifunctional adenosylcobalamin biosynthesis protein n=2 Tax=Jhaorihella thermophila TaxID=488547 RepID=A0A1H5W451_9RHOB|nr:adenosylcobinamide kinase / adenosylcobinamide-phosphate guanylyltransferase [Jhaorihella thermophila]